MESTKYSNDTNAVVKRVDDIVVLNAHQYDAAKHYFDTIRLLKKTIVDDFEDGISKAWATHKSLKAQEKGHLEPLVKAEKALHLKLDIYIEEQRKIREAAERKAKEEAERLRKEEEDRVLKEAAEIKENGASEELIERCLDQAIITDTPVVEIPEEPNYDKRVFGKKRWAFEIIDDSKIPSAYLVIDMKAIGNVVKALKGKTDIPGIRVFEEPF